MYSNYYHPAYLPISSVAQGSKMECDLCLGSIKAYLLLIELQSEEAKNYKVILAKSWGWSKNYVDKICILKNVQKCLLKGVAGQKRAKFGLRSFWMTSGVLSTEIRSSFC